MDLDSLKYFVRVCAEGSVTKAAERLSVTQQAVSRKIIVLEEELGAKLLIRSTSGVIPTADGLRLLDSALRILGEMGAIKANFAERSRDERTVLNMGFAPGTLFSLGVDKIVTSTSSFKGVRFDLSEHPDADCERLVKDRLLDLAITLRPETTGGLVYESLLLDDLVVLVGEGHPLAETVGGVDLVDALAHPLITLDGTFRLQQMMDRWFARRSLTPTVLARINHDLNVAYDLVSLSRGVFIFVKSLSLPSPAQKVRILPLADAEVRWDIGVVCRPDTLARHPVISKFIQSCRPSRPAP